MRFFQSSVLHSISRILRMLDSSGVSSLVPWMVTTLLPDLQSPMSRAVLITNCKRLSVPWKEGILYPMTPREVFSCLMTGLETLQARIGTEGLYLETSLASLPESVKTIIRSTSKSLTVPTAAAATDSAVSTPAGVFFLMSLKSYL